MSSQGIRQFVCINISSEGMYQSRRWGGGVGGCGVKLVCLRNCNSLHHKIGNNVCRRILLFPSLIMHFLCKETPIADGAST